MRGWYIIQTYSGYEKSVARDLINRIQTLNQQDYIFNVLVPEEEYVEEKKDGTKVTKTRVIHPSYVFVEMIVNEKSWFIVRNTPKVTGILGSRGGGTLPVPVPQEEMNKILAQVGLISKPTYDFKVGDKLEVISGAFKGRIIDVVAVDEQKETITFMFELFNRLTPSEVKFDEVKKYEAPSEETKEEAEEQAEADFEEETEDDYEEYEDEEDNGDDGDDDDDYLYEDYDE